MILIPTERERQVIERSLSTKRPEWQLHTTGFGVIASAVNATRLIHQTSPDLVVVAGIAGRFDRVADRRFPIGQAVWFSEVRIDGIGVGQGERFIDSDRLGWRSPFGDQETGAIDLWKPPGEHGGTLVTVCSGSSTPQEAAWRGERFPTAVAEDMESYAVAAACRIAGVRCAVLRGLSNDVGCRDHSRWKVDEALVRVADRLRDFIEDSES